ncbi:MAG: exodeoxyribonuclease VII large subunit [Deltaproteobacteria bacterium]|nr:exodeoxyribonuclease VII large subunit [Deltaproteobacteria bacterium]
MDKGPEEKTTPKIYSVSELTRQIRSNLEKEFVEVWIAAEISNFRSPSSGHFYFTLKDDKAQISAVMFHGANGNLPFKLAEGLEVICHGRVTVYESRGQYQIVVDHCEPKGIGALQLAFEQLKKKLQAEDLFETRHKKPLPFLPKTIGVVTSSTGAAIQDILKVLHRRFPSVDVILAAVKVQGEGSAEEIAEAISLLNQRDDIDVMIVGRGGGSMEDLWAFNEEVVARAIFASRIPIISAVGHEIDFTIADFVADVRAPTPSAAAEIAVPKREDLLMHLEQLKQQLFKSPLRRFPDLMMRSDDLRSRLQFGWQVSFDKRFQHFKKLCSNLDHLSPLNVLAKGYSVVQKVGDPRPIKSTKDLKKGEEVEITFHEGKSTAKLTEVS